MQFKQIFKLIGFRKHSYKIYETLLRSKQPLLIMQIAKDASISRPEIYRSLKQFLEKKFIKRVIYGKRNYYTAENPKHIGDEFKKVSESVSTFAKQKATKKERFLPEHIRYFKEFSGIRAAFDDVIAHTPRGETFYRYTSERNLDEVNRYLSPDYRARRDKNKLERMVISNPVSGKQKRSRLERFIKYIPPEVDLFDQNIIQLIYGNRLAFINLNEEEAYIIEDKPLSDFQKVIFKQLYKKL